MEYNAKKNIYDLGKIRSEILFIFERREIQIWNLMIEKHISNVGKVRSGILLQSNNFYDVK